MAGITGQLVDDVAEAADFVEEDFDEEFTTEAGACIWAAFIPNAVILDRPSHVGQTATEKAQAFFRATSSLPAEGDILTRVLDATNWQVILVRPAQFGLVTVDLQDVRTIAQGLL